MKVNINDLQTARNFAESKGVTTMTIYRWLKHGVVKGIDVDGVKFVVKENPTKKQG
tara:strand:+ start:651 stop:818 length:168 start_codon:yes stop_codon:yes gene_type:complete